MAQILETIMLICFGLSWPISLVKTIRDKEKTGNLPFMCLILLGYAAGIAAKLMTVGANLVFFVYLLNIFMVLANLAVTIKRHHTVKQPSHVPTCNKKTVKNPS